MRVMKATRASAKSNKGRSDNNKDIPKPPYLPKHSCIILGRNIFCAYRTLTEATIHTGCTFLSQSM
eukprot:scaffold9733_cov144-Skeletonema_marinoi.AAC.1